MHSGHPRFCEPVRLFDRERKIVDVRVCKLFFAKHRGLRGVFPSRNLSPRHLGSRGPQQGLLVGMASSCEHRNAFRHRVSAGVSCRDRPGEHGGCFLAGLRSGSFPTGGVLPDWVFVGH